MSLGQVLKDNQRITACNTNAIPVSQQEFRRRKLCFQNSGRLEKVSRECLII